MFKRLINLFSPTKFFIGIKAKILFVLLCIVKIVIWPIKFIHYTYYLYILYFVLGHLLRDAKVKIDNKTFILQNASDLFILSAEKELESFIPEKGRVFIDVGAHIGKYSILKAERFEKILAIEPEPGNYFYLQQNIKLNNLESKIKAINLAFYNKSGKKITLTRGRYNLGGHTIITPQKHKILYKDQIWVETIKMDDLIKKENISPKEIDFIKVDVEGAEAMVFEGGRDTLREGNPKILFEVWSYNQESMKNCRRILEGLGYQIKPITGDYYLAERSKSNIDN